MRIVRSFADYEPDADLLLSIGVFDGVHVGHRAVLRRLSAQRGSGTRSGAMTFERHPQAFLRQSGAPKSITTTDEKINLLDGCGIDVLFLLPFDERIAELSAETFLRDVLLKRLRTRLLAVGENWRFGKGRTGDPALARRVLEPAGCRVESADLTEVDGEKVSSSRIRTLIETREFEEADRLLGSEFTVRGVVSLGDGRGHLLGFPTANLEVHSDKILPSDGVYAATATLEGADARAVVSIGTKPTFDGHALTVEAYLLGFDRSIYGETLALRRWRFVREQQRFANAQALVEAMHRDVALVRSL
ncbi:MAG TPA: riboflavin biosynthesis protein RibF [Candidatus Eremiobacteraceae bacterium]|nr:riboflavin biosynthesis protein RibF [Candidatus Eremiobacteraceae bacterium]